MLGDESQEKGIRVTEEDVMIRRLMVGVRRAAWRREWVMLRAGRIMSVS